MSWEPIPYRLSQTPFTHMRFIIEKTSKLHPLTPFGDAEVPRSELSEYYHLVAVAGRCHSQPVCGV